MDRVTRPRKIEGKTIKGVDFFNPTERTLIGALRNPKFNITGIRRADLSPLLQELSPSALSRQIRRLRHLGLIKRVARTYRHYLHRRRKSRHRRSLSYHGIRHRSCAHLTKSVRKMTRLDW